MRPSSPTIHPSRSVAKQVPNRLCRTSRSETGVPPPSAPRGTQAMRASNTPRKRLIWARGSRTSRAFSRAGFRVSTALREFRSLRGPLHRCDRRLEHVFHLKAHVVAVAKRADLPRRGGLDARVVEAYPEGVPDECDAGLEDEGTLPVIEHRVDRHDAPSRVGREDGERLQELVVVDVEEAGLEAARPALELRAALAAPFARDGEVRGQRQIAERDRQDEVAGRVHDVLVEELRRDEEGRTRVQLTDEAVDVESERHVEGVAREQ